MSNFNRAALGCGDPRLGCGDPTIRCGDPTLGCGGTEVFGNAAPQYGSVDDKRRESISGKSCSQQNRGYYTRGYLPHFDSPHAIQHITYRLADSLPRLVLEQMQAEVKTSLQDDEKRKSELRQRIETYLDAGHGSCILQDPEVAACVIDTWHHFDGERYHLLEWVVMPNHCHVLIEQIEGVSLGKIVLSWKNYTARWINEYKRRTGTLLSRENSDGEKVWHREYWDRCIRNERHFLTARDYIIMNPVKAGLVARPSDWQWGSAKSRVENNETSHC
ncbi:MAG TPA: transposase [Smithellaceae bacterium]|nr:transposase [Smithellaceae bacterium]